MLLFEDNNFNFECHNDYGKINEAIKNLSDSLTTAAKNEIDLGSKIRELEHKCI